MSNELRTLLFTAAAMIAFAYLSLPAGTGAPILFGTAVVLATRARVRAEPRASSR